MKGIMAYPKLKVKSDRPLNPAAQQSFFSFSINIKFIVWNELYTNGPRVIDQNLTFYNVPYQIM